MKNGLYTNTILFILLFSSFALYPKPLSIRWCMSCDPRTTCYVSMSVTLQWWILWRYYL